MRMNNKQLAILLSILTRIIHIKRSKLYESVPTGRRGTGRNTPNLGVCKTPKFVGVT